MTAREISFFVEGEPRPGGSKTVIHFRGKNGDLKVRMVHSARFGRDIPSPVFSIIDAADNGDWKKAVAAAGTVAMGGMKPWAGALKFTMRFDVERPGYQYQGGNKDRPVRDEYAEAYPIIAPDTTKLVRAAEDALTGIVWTDDAIVVDQHASKGYARRGHPIGLFVSVAMLEPASAQLFGTPPEPPR